MKLFASLIFGILVGISGTFLHNSYHPLGVVVSLFAVWLGSRLVRNMYQSRSTKLLFALGWFLVIVRGSTLGNGGEILIEANLYGNLLVFGGAGLLTLSMLRS
ncbi:MAG: hypothetical protein RLZZ19_843 [Actinomycetota bacterium]